MKRSFRSVFAVLALMMLSALPACALTIGTFNIEYFDISGSDRYVPSDLQELAANIRKSGADVLALQEIEGNATMRFFTMTALRGWQYAGNDTNYKQDPYFLWNPAKVTLLDGPTPYFVNASFRHDGKTRKLFDRAPLVAVFKDNETGKKYTMINVHFKSMSTRGKEDIAAAQEYNSVKRSLQIRKVNELVAGMRGPVFIMGDYNSTNPGAETDFPLLTLERGYTYDNKKSNLDYIGYVGISRNRLGEVRETESRIRRRSTKRVDHPDHDIITIEVR